MKNQQPSLPSRIFDNFLNGNLSDAQKTSKRVKYSDLYAFAYYDIGWDVNISIAAASYLKGVISFHSFCKIKEKNK